MANVKVENRTLDRYLTNFIQRYTDGKACGDFIAPAFEVKISGDKYKIYGKANFRNYDNRIKGREKAKEVETYIDEGDYSCVEYSLAAFVEDKDVRDSLDVPRLKEVKIQTTADAQMRSREKRILDVATSQSLVTQNDTPTNKWDNKSNGQPVDDILNAMVTIENSSAKTPNSIVMGLNVALKLVQTDSWKDYFKYTESGTKKIFSAVDGLRSIGLEPFITGVRGLNTNQGGASDPAWEKMIGENVIIFYREPRPTKESNTFMFSPFTKMNSVEQYRVNGERGVRYEIYEEIDELLVNQYCAYLYYNVLAT